MRVLLLTYFYPPSPDVGGLRAARLAASLRARGADVTVIAGPLGEDAVVADSPVEHDVIRVEPFFDPRARYLQMRGRRRSTATPESNGAAPAWTPPPSTPFLKRQISSALWLPDDRNGWIVSAAARIRRMLRTGAFDLVYSSSPPASVQVAGLLGRPGRSVAWVAEFRDPWTDNPWKPDFVRSAWSDATERWLERRVLRGADLVVAVTNSTAELLRRKIPPAQQDRVITVLNGIEARAATRQAAGPIRTVVYAGRLGHGRDPRPFLGAVAALRSRGELADDCRIEFIGDCRIHQGIDIAAFAKTAGLDDVLEFHDTMPHDMCLERIRAADLLLLLAQDQPLQVPNKLFEYLAANRRILAFADAGGETAAMLREVGGHSIVDTGDPVRTEHIVAEAFRDQGGPPPAENVLADWSWERQFERLFRRLESLQ